MGEKAFRDRIYLLTTLFSILVIWVHSFNAQLFLGEGEEAAFLYGAERVPGFVLGQIAVPGFFVISAYLFFRGFCMDALAGKWERRTRSVLIPYFLWNGLYYLGYALLPRIGAVAGLIGREAAPLSVYETLEALLLYTYNPVFWYLEQLIFLIALAPLLYMLLKDGLRAAVFFGILLSLFWMNKVLPVLNADALFYYSVGAFAALHGDILCGGFLRGVPGRRMAVGTLLVCFVLLLWLGMEGNVLYGRILYTVLLRLLGVTACILLIWLLPSPGAPEWMKHNFFVYATHFIWVRLINKTGARFFSGNAAVAYFLYLSMPVWAYMASLCIRRVMARFFPRVCSVLSGGR